MLHNNQIVHSGDRIKPLTDRALRRLDQALHGKIELSGNQSPWLASCCFEVGTSYPWHDHYKAKFPGWIDGAEICWEGILLLLYSPLISIRIS
jgi:hypothetical protein